MALLGALVDNFQGPTLDTAKWTAVNTPGNSGTQAGGQYTFIVKAASTGDASLVSVANYNLTGSHVHIELISAGVQESGLEMYPIILTQSTANTNNSILIVVTNGLVGIYQFVAGVAHGMAFPAYNPTAMRWWRIRHVVASNLLFIESAPRVQGPWTVQASGAPLIAITALFMRVRTFDFLSLTTAKQTAVSNVNYLAPPDLEFPNGALTTFMDMAFGADLDGDQTLWTWTSLTPEDAESLFMKQTVTPTRGRADESSDTAPTQASMTLDNPNGDLTPDNPVSIYYPNVDLGTPARWGIEASTPRLWVRPADGANAQVASIATLNITADLDVRIDMHMKTMHPSGVAAVVVGRAVNGVGAPYSWRVEVQPDRTVRLFWSPTGTAPASQATSTVPVIPMSARATLRITLDVNNGASGYDVKFYIGTTGVNGTFTQVGPTITGAGVTSVSNAATSLIIGSPTIIGQTFALDADVYRFQLRQGIGGTPIVDADFTAQVSEVTSFVDSTGLLWTVVGAARLTDQWIRVLGTADEWAPKWPWGDLSSQQNGGLGKGQARTDVAVAGILRRLGQGAAPLSSPMFRAISSSPLTQAYWPMEDEDGATQIASGIPGGIPMTWAGAIDFAAVSSLQGSKPVPTLDDATTLVGPVVGTFTGQWQVDWYVLSASPGPASPTTILSVTGTPGATIATWTVELSAGALTVNGRNTSGTVITTNTTLPSGFFSGWQHVRLTAQQSGGNVSWNISWFPVVVPPASGFFFTGVVAGTVGGVVGVGVPPSSELGGISMGQMSVLNAFNITVTNGADVGWSGDTAAARMIRLCAEQGINFRIIGAPSTTALMGVQQIATLLTLLDDAKDVDGGILYEQLDTVGLIYRTRESLYNQPANMILDGLTKQISNPFSPILDDQRVRNDITVTRRGGSSVQVIDQASIDKRGIYDESVTLNLYADTQLSDAAGWRLHQGTVPGMRYPQLGTNLGVAPEVIDAWLTVDQGAQVWAINLPPQHPTATVKVLAEGYSEPISPFTWDPTVNCSPAQVWDVAILYGDWVPDQYLLRLDSDASELNAGINAVVLSMVVKVTAGPAWVTAGAEFPFDVNVGGERIRVTAVAAAVGALQTFTIVRAVNGVVKSHAAGSPVFLWFRPVLAR